MSEPVAWRVATGRILPGLGWMLFDDIGEAQSYCDDDEPEPLYPADELERKDAAIAELKAENRALSNRAIDCEMSWTHERAERAEMAIAELVGALKMIATAEGDSTCDDGYSPEEIALAAIAKYDIPKDGL